MGFLDKLIPQSLKSAFKKPNEQMAQGYRTFTEYSPAFAPWDGNLYEQAQTRAIVERIATACSKLKPEFVTPEGSGGSVPRIQRLIASWPNEMMTWPQFLKRTATILWVDTVVYVCPEYDARDASAIVGLWPMKPTKAEVVDYDGEPWIRFFLATGDIQAFPFYDVAILTRFQLESDIFGGGNAPLTPTLRLMDAQRQAEEIALKTGADIRFIGKVTTNMHEEDLRKYRDRFSSDNFGPTNKSALILHDNRIDQLQQVDPQRFVADKDEMERIDKALYAYFGINEKILNSEYDEMVWNAFYENVIEPFAIQLGEKLSQVILTPTQVRKGNRIMFSSSYLEYASVDSKIKVANLLTTTGTGTRNEVRDIFQLPRTENGDVFMVRGEIYVMDMDNNIIAESGGHNSEDQEPLDLDEPDGTDINEVSRQIQARLAEMIDRRVSEIA